MSIGKIAPIQIIPSENVKSMGNALSLKGKTKYPGTGNYFFPKKLPNGKYVTGLDENDESILRIQDPKERKAEQDRVKKKRKRLEDATGFDLSNRSSYWDYSLYSAKDQAHVQPIKLGDTTATFNLSIPEEEITFTWLKQHDLIASSYEAFMRGDKGPQVVFYVMDEEAENKVKYDRKQRINKAVAANEKLSPTVRKKIAILMGLGISENANEESVYNIIDDILKETEFKSGKFKGQTPVVLFTNLIELDSKVLNMKFLVEESLRYNIYRKRSTGIFEGELKIADTETDLVARLCDDDSVEEVLALEAKVKAKKI